MSPHVDFSHWNFDSKIGLTTSAMYSWSVFGVLFLFDDYFICEYYKEAAHKANEQSEIGIPIRSPFFYLKNIFRYLLCAVYGVR